MLVLVGVVPLTISVFTYLRETTDVKLGFLAMTGEGETLLRSCTIELFSGWMILLSKSP